MSESAKISNFHYSLKVMSLSTIKKEKRGQDIESSYSLPYAFPQNWQLLTSVWNLPVQKREKTKKMDNKRAFMFPELRPWTSLGNFLLQDI